MKKVATNSTVNFEPVVISKEASIKFSMTTDAVSTTLYGSIVKNGAEVGSVSFDSKGNGYLYTNIKALDVLTSEEVDEIYNQVPTCVREATEMPIGTSEEAATE